jgi:hypothetical protein
LLPANSRGFGLGRDPENGFASRRARLVELYPLVKADQKILARAREALREFIRATFFLEDLLHTTTRD